MDTPKIRKPNSLLDIDMEELFSPNSFSRWDSLSKEIQERSPVGKISNAVFVDESQPPAVVSFCRMVAAHLNDKMTARLDKFTEDINVSMMPDLKGE